LIPGKIANFPAPCYLMDNDLKIASVVLVLHLDTGLHRRHP
jgi:hypothetical protein